MDALSTLLQQTQHLSETKYYGLKVTGDWAYSITNSDTIYFYLVQSGSFNMKIGDVSQRIHKGDIVMVPNANKHVCYAQNHHGNNAKPLDKTLFNYDQGTIECTQGITLNAQLILVECQYDKDLLGPLLSALPVILPEHEHMHESRFRSLDRAVGFLRLESEYERLGKLAMINLWASIVMVECLRTYIESLPNTTKSWLVAIKDPYLSKALTFMHDKPNYSWTTHQLAREAGMSRSSFTQRFKDTVGVPPMTYLIEYRLRIAARHLRLQQNSIGQISELIGYASNSTFSQAFKRLYGMSPREYRQQHRVAISI
ncbi:AraC family transcriptional regulator [Psychrobacter sp. DAB_AL62B]|uniref:AraC family transcriptional regulator n=1 Tax=Psychrobacter sp. DAB_AL62B TaxID=1028420 RepID=UPI002380D9BA|nr:AraC family transcriptional regulator [Psychrobacter sp. DAB_AL62B]MDE4456065.1 AraC family transcriptional regulator [Psychrobacter sp. DAB_AL62B]